VTASSRANEVEAAANWCYYGHEPTIANVRLRQLSQRARFAGAFKTLGVCWLLAVVAVFMPVLHFVLVPGLLLLGPLLFLGKLAEGVTLLGATGPCPACGATITHRVKLRALPKMEIRCDGCGRAIELVIPDALMRAPD
jgi:hypothetical protein